MSLQDTTVGAADAVDARFGSSKFLRRAVRKAFPDHWSFLLGEIALYSFFVLLMTGVFLTFFFKPSATEVIYNGPYQQLRGVRMSEAYASTLRISFEVRGGLLVRQIHHWAANIFLASMLVHMLRVFFTGAFRKPREISWLIGIVLLVLSLAEGFLGYSMPDDLLSGTGLRIAQGLVQGVPLVGSYLSFFLFGGQFPGHEFIPRFYILHVLLIPGLLAALVPLHGVVLTWRLMHTHFPGRGRRERNQIGKPFFPAFVIKTTAFFMFVFAVTAGMATFFQVNPLWLYGPYTPTAVSAGSQPDWYLGWLEGALRIMPAWEINLLGHPLALSLMVPGIIVPGIFFTGLAMYPFIEKWATDDNRYHNLLDRPRNATVRTSIGAAGVTFFGVLWLAGGNDIIANRFHISLFATTWLFRTLVVVGPIIAYVVAGRICVGLQRKDLATLEHGVETGVITQNADGEFTETHRSVSEHQEAVLRAKKKLPAVSTEPDGNGVPEPASRRVVGRLRVALNRAYIADESIGTNGNGHGRPALSGNGNGHALAGHGANGKDRREPAAGVSGDAQGGDTGSRSGGHA
jgi:ubiquinol-cytochrome c reductase cytochrome b subunit